MTVQEKLSGLFKAAGAGPFLFVGSGFSRRYLGLEDWKGLLSRFCVAGSPFEFYLSRSDGDYPAAAKLIASDFNEYWWKSPDYVLSVDRHKSKIKDSTSALRVEISNYLAALNAKEARSSELGEEVAILASLNVDGIITTNWDLLLEDLFPDYRVYVGQSELLFSNPQQIGEIYKIHGCATRPESLVLTADDYHEFNEQNSYLAAKLITVFVEHPIVFVGYSLSDKNIATLLRSISLCVGKDNVEKLRRNLIFVQRLGDGEESGVSDTYLTIDGVQIPLVLVKTNNYAEVYRAIDDTKRKIPARILRYCKEQLYELVRSLQPEKKLCVLDIDSIDQKDDVEFLVGIGVASQEIGAIAKIGYEAIDAKDLILDVLHDNRDFDAREVLDSVIKRAGKNTKNVPVFKYLRAAGIENHGQYKESGLDLGKWVDQDLKNFRVKLYAGQFFKIRHYDMKMILDDRTPEQASTLIPFLAKEKIDLPLLRGFLIDNEDKLDYKASNYASYFRKLATIYDRLSWGWADGAA